MTQSTIITMEAKDSATLEPPSSFSASWICSTFSSISSASPRMEPYMMPIRNRPTPNPVNIPRCSRTAKPNGVVSAAEATGLPSLAGRRPAPTSRRVLRAKPTAAQARAAARVSRSGHQVLST
jgi:hypothetical protein